MLRRGRIWLIMRGRVTSPSTPSMASPLAARHFPVAEPTARLVVAGATGVPQGFYANFAAYANSRGYDVVTFDYRGVGG